MGKHLIPIGIVVLLLITGFYLFNSKQTNKTANTQVSSPTNQQITFAIDGVFEGITPCSNVDRPLPQIPANANCEMAIWHVTFNPDATYSLTMSYGMTQPNTTGIRGGGTKVIMEGKWTIIEGTSTNPKAVVIQLNTANPQTSASFLKVSDNIIHLLDIDKNMMVGNGGWAYTLSRTNDLVANDAPLPSIPAGSSTLGIFEGRTLCLDFLAEFTQQPTNCDRIKWKLTLNPTRYLLQTSRGSVEGSWSTEGNVYQLKSNKTAQILLLLKVDDNHLFFLDENMNLLVGNSLWSYTLSRTNKGM